MYGMGPEIIPVANFCTGRGRGLKLYVNFPFPFDLRELSFRNVTEKGFPSGSRGKIPPVQTPDNIGYNTPSRNAVLLDQTKKELLL